jgi:hypothetical protein
MDMNLDGPTCVENLDVPLQVANMTWFINIQKEGFEFEFNPKPSYTFKNTIRVLQKHRSCYNDTRGVIALPP